MLTDDEELQRLGYAQQLRRKMGAFGSFALSFSVISILTGGLSLYGYGLSLGGPFEMTVGWPLVSVMTLLVAMSLAELASAYPTAGALYHWASILGGSGLGWFTAWMNLIGQVAVVAGVDYAFAEFLRPMLGLPEGRHQVLEIYAAVLLSHGLLNHVGIGVVTALNELSAWYHFAGTALLVAALAFLAPHQPAEFLLRRFCRGSAQRCGLSVRLRCAGGNVAGAVDFHRLRRLSARGGGDGRRQSGRAAGHRQLGDRFGAGRIRHAARHHALDSRSAGDGQGRKPIFVCARNGARRPSRGRAGLDGDRRHVVLRTLVGDVEFANAVCLRSGRRASRSAAAGAGERAIRHAGVGGVDLCRGCLPAGRLERGL